MEELSGAARNVADASGCAYADALQGAYQMAQTTVAQWPDAATFATAYLENGVTSVRAQLRVKAEDAGVGASAVFYPVAVRSQGSP